MKSILGFVLAGLYLAVVAYLITTQGLFGESFIALIAGMPWVLLPAYFEFGGGSPAVGYILLLAPIAINAALLYWIGSLAGRLLSRSSSQ